MNNKRMIFKANGTTGEGMTMSVKERKEIAEAWSDSAKRNSQHLVIQVGGAPIADVKELVRIQRLIKICTHSWLLTTQKCLCFRQNTLNRWMQMPSCVYPSFTTDRATRKNWSTTLKPSVKQRPRLRFFIITIRSCQKSTVSFHNLEK